ncbi:glycosyltransferase family 25 protein [Campylobacter sp. MG1]|nr:glycosyltransferase family 25 protein [Campylobacter sp. MG1]
MNIYVINLKTSVDRFEKMNKEIEKLPQNMKDKFIFFNAIDGRGG